MAAPYPLEAGPALRRVAIVSPSAAVLADRFGGLIHHLRGLGHKVMCLAPDLTEQLVPDEMQRWRQLGVEVATFPFVAGQRMWSDYSTNRGLLAHMRAWQPHAAIGMGHTLGPMSVDAAARAGAKRTLVALSGLTGARKKQANLALLRKALAAGHTPLCSSADDMRAVLQIYTEVAAGPPARVTPVCVAPAGADLETLATVPLPPIGSGFVFAMAAPMHSDQGIEAYCGAARLVRARSPQTRFLLAATSRIAVAPQVREILAAAREIVEDVGYCADVPAFLASAHVAVSVPVRDDLLASAQTALALGRPLIVSNTPDVCDLVDESVNGHRVDAGDEQALAEAMMAILRRKDLVPAMGRASRAKAVRNYDRRVLLPQMLAALGIASAIAGKAA